MTRQDRPLLVIVPAGAPPEQWHDARDAGVTASEIHRIAQGSRQTHRTILDEKLNGRTFTGNRHTRRGHVREAELLHYASTHIAPDSGITPNSALFGHPDHPLHRATPDGLGWDAADRGIFGVEVKSHDHTWSKDEIPAAHLDQMLFGMWVIDADWWLYVWEVMGPDGEPTLDEPQYRWVHRADHEARLMVLVAEAEVFIAWREDGAPDLDDIPDEVDEALTEDAAAAAIESAAKKRRAKVKPIIVGWLDSLGGTVRKTGTRAEIVRTAETVDVVDEDAWAKAAPDRWARYEELCIEAVDAESHAAEIRAKAATLVADAIAEGHRKTETKYGPVRTTPRKEKAA